MVDYKTKYEEALKRAKNLEGAWSSEQAVAEYIFPELGENDDERIRKAMLEFFHSVSDEAPFWDKSIFLSKKEIVTWLEKQGEHAKFRESIQIGDKVTRNQDGVLVNLSQLKRVAKQIDKVESKFKVGDWVVNNRGEVNQVVKIGSDGDGFTLDDDTYFSGTWADMYHLWTIQDAKPGDVLATLDYILIFKESTKDDGGVSYCHYDFTAYRPQFNWLEDKNWYFGKEAKVYPATKEQRNLLFSKMEEAGYEWDAEKLKLIEHTNQMSELTEFDKAVGVSIGTWNPTTPEQIERVKAVSNKLLKLARKQIINEQKSTEWSEEDETRLTNIIIMLKEGASHHFIKDDIKKSVDWLKSLRPQDRWKPSQEQMDALRQAERKEETNHFVLNSLIADLEKII